MLDAPEAFFFRRGDDFTIAEQTSCRVAVVGVEAEEIQNGYPSRRGSDLLRYCHHGFGQGRDAADTKEAKVFDTRLPEQKAECCDREELDVATVPQRGEMFVE